MGMFQRVKESNVQGSAQLWGVEAGGDGLRMVRFGRPRSLLEVGGHGRRVASHSKAVMGTCRPHARRRPLFPYLPIRTILNSNF